MQSYVPVWNNEQALSYPPIWSPCIFLKDSILLHMLLVQRDVLKLMCLVVALDL